MPAKKATPPSKPTYAVMVAESIKALKDRTGSSVQAISKHVQAQYHIDINKPALVKAIKKGVEAGDLVQIKASYKLNKLKKAPPAPKKKVVAPVKKKTVSKPAPKKATAVKKTSLKPKKAISKKTSTKKSSTISTKKVAPKTSKKVAPKKTAPKKKSSAK